MIFYKDAEIETKSTSENNLSVELNNCLHIGLSQKKYISDYLTKNYIYSMQELTISDVIKFRKVTYMRTQGTIVQKKYQASLLEQCIAAYQRCQATEVVKEIEFLTIDGALKNKLMVFFFINDIKNIEQLTYESRMQYKDFLRKTVANSKVLEYLRAYDQLKLKDIKRKNQGFRKEEFDYKDAKIFLLYHPNYEIAKSFYYTRNKEELLYDFSISASEKMKHQIFEMLNHILRAKKNKKDRRERYLIPLQLFYKFCINERITDIEQITEEERKKFSDTLKGRCGSKEKIYIQIVDNICKYLFISGKNINWNATTWYLERFNFKEGRINPAREIQRIRFGEIEILENREMFQLYFKYQIGISSKNAIQTIRMQYYSVKEFLKYLDEQEIRIYVLTEKQIEKYIKRLLQQNIQAETYNHKLITIARFLEYLQIKKKIPKVTIHFGYYLKKTITKHNDRMVSPKKEMEILDNLKYFPEELRMMYLNLWCLGLRVNEVCVIRQDAYKYDGKNAWIRVYQNKMKAEKEIPIPMELYELMEEYIKRKKRLPGEYVFQNKKGKAYDAATFSKQFRNRLKKLGISDYTFKSHDFRHTVATQLYEQNVPIQVIRDYLGHKSSEMTKHYLDMFMESVLKDSEEYFRN